MHIRGLLSLVMSVDLKLSVSTWSSGICSLFTGMLLGSVGLHIRDKTNKKVQTEHYQECGSEQAWTPGEAERGC